MQSMLQLLLSPWMSRLSCQQLSVSSSYLSLVYADFGVLSMDRIGLQQMRENF